jgi:hypothetical protein
VAAYLLAFSLALLAPDAASAPRQVCPPAPGRVEATVTVAVTFEAATGLYTYRYTVTNRSSSKLPLDHFAIDFDDSRPLSDIAQPKGWADLIAHNRASIAWMALEAKPLQRSAKDDGGIPHGIGEIPPGRTATGFVFRSPLPPGPVRYYVQGFRDIVGADSEAEAEWIADNCPGVVGGFFETAVTGSTRGPARALRPLASPPTR